MDENNTYGQQPNQPLNQQPVDAANTAARQEAADAAYGRSVSGATAPQQPYNAGSQSPYGAAAQQQPYNAGPQAPYGATAQQQPYNAGAQQSGYQAYQSGPKRPEYADAPNNGRPMEYKEAKKAAKQAEKARKKAERQQQPRGRLLPSFLSGLGGALVVVIIAALVFALVPGVRNTVSGSTSGTITIKNSEASSTAEAVADKCLDSVVTVYVYSSSSDWSNYFGGSSSSSSSPSALGSGVIIKSDSSESYVLTNYHVIEDSSKQTVKVGDTSYDAEVVGTDATTDLAVIKIKKGGLTTMEWGDSSEIEVGDWVMAIGSPYGYEQTCTTGIVSAMYRSDTLSNESNTGYTTYTDMIQTDAAINPGNSGGALVNAEGQLIGINTYISSTSQSSAGLGFAIPVNAAKNVAEQLMEGKEVEHPFLGVTMENSTDPVGVSVASVEADTAADNAGIKKGDVITKIGDTTISDTDDLSAAISRLSVGDKVKVTFVRDGKTKTVTATIGKRDTESTSSSNSSNGSDNSGSNGYGYGFDLGDLFGNSGSDGYGYGYGSGSGNGSSNGF